MFLYCVYWNIQRITRKLHCKQILTHHLFYNFWKFPLYYIIIFIKTLISIATVLMCWASNFCKNKKKYCSMQTIILQLFICVKHFKSENSYAIWINWIILLNKCIEIYFKKILYESTHFPIILYGLILYDLMCLTGLK